MRQRTKVFNSVLATAVALFAVLAPAVIWNASYQCREGFTCPGTVILRVESLTHYWFGVGGVYENFEYSVNWQEASLSRSTVKLSSTGQI